MLKRYFAFLYWRSKIQWSNETLAINDNEVNGQYWVTSVYLSHVQWSIEISDMEGFEIWDAPTWEQRESFTTSNWESTPVLKICYKKYNFCGWSAFLFWRLMMAVLTFIILIMCAFVSANTSCGVSPPVQKMRNWIMLCGNYIHFRF